MPINVEPTIQTGNRNPEFVLNAEDLQHLESLADGIMKRHPTLANRFFEEIGRAQIVAPGEIPKDVVGKGSSVTYRNETTGRLKSVTLVYPEYADITRLRVSVMTPIGGGPPGFARRRKFPLGHARSPKTDFDHPSC